MNTTRRANTAAAVGGAAAACVSLLLLLLQLAPHAAAQTLLGVFRNAVTGCSVLAINAATGTNVTLNANVALCSQVQQTWPSFAVYDFAAQELVVAVATAPNVASFNPTTGAEGVYAPLPAYNQSDEWLGMVRVAPSNGASPAIYLVSQYHLWQVTAAGLNLVLNVNLPADAVVAAANSGGTGGAGRIFVADGGSNAVYTLDLGALSNVRTPL